LKGDTETMDEVRAQAKGDSGAEDFIAHQTAFVLASSGRLHEARRMSQRAADLAKHYGHNERAAMFETRAALWEAFLGNGPAARRGAVAALEVARNREVVFGSSFALAMVGDSSRSRVLVDDLEKQYPEDTSVQFFYLP